MAAKYRLNAQILITVVAGLFILPFFLFSSLAGQISDKYEKSQLIRKIKFAEIILMLLTAMAFHFVQMWWLIALLFLMGAQSTFFGPLKYSVLPRLLREDELVAGNGLVNAGTNVAILTGTLCGGLLIMSPLGRYYISIGVVAVAAAGYLASRFIPELPASSPELKIDRNLFRSTWRLISYPAANRPVFLSIIGISWFWFLGSVFLAQFPSFAKDVIGGDEQVSTSFLVIFTVGIGFGATFCNKLLKGRVSARFVPASLVTISVFIIALYAASPTQAQGGELFGVAEFLSSARAWPVILSMFAIAASGGLYSIPMYAMMQRLTPATHMARTVASLNIMDSLFMVVAAVLMTAMIACGMSINALFLSMAFINLLMLPLVLKLSKTTAEEGGVGRG